MSLSSTLSHSTAWRTDLSDRTGIRHMHWQLLATPASLIHRNLVTAAFKALGKNYEYPPFQSCEPDILIPNQHVRLLPRLDLVSTTTYPKQFQKIQFKPRPTLQMALRMMMITTTTSTIQT